jgi:hypothetical protein
MCLFHLSATTRCNFNFFADRGKAIFGIAILALATAAFGQVNVTTQHNDRSRTGQNTAEAILTPANVSVNTFGKKFVQAVDGHVYAQPLYLSNVTIPNKGVHNVLYVATEHDSIYAFDADNNTGANSTPLWQTSFIDPANGITSVPSGDVACADLIPEVGITGTPVIDPTAKTIYLVAKTKENGTVVQRLHALDATTGAERLYSPVVIQASVPGTGDGSRNGVLAFNPLSEGQRAGLLLMQGMVYIAWASHCDNYPFHGWILGYNAKSLKQRAVFNSTPNGGLGGFWASGSGLAGDPVNNALFAATGNGTFDANNAGGIDYGDSIVRLDWSTGVFGLHDYFTPYNEAALEHGDTDLGSGGVLLLPTQPVGSPHQQLLVQAGKGGSVYLVDRTSMGNFNSTNNSQIVQFLPNAVGGVWSMPAWWNNRLYFGGSGEEVRVFTFNPSTGKLSASPASKSTMMFKFPGVTPAISAHGTKNGILWAVETDKYGSSGPAILHAFDAMNLATELYNSGQNATRDGLTAATKFVVPTIANGNVYVGSYKQVTVFGLLQ